MKLFLKFLWTKNREKWKKKIHILFELLYFGTIDILDIFINCRIAVPLNL
jgi:hypothetical protein